MNARLETLMEIEAAAWHQLARAAADTSHAWRTPVLATIASGRDGHPSADARTVVLREVDATSHTLVFFTDARAPKLRQLRAAPRGTLLFWSPALAWQLRCAVTLQAEHEGLAVASRWARIASSPASQDYLSPLPPGSPLETAAPQTLPREHFAVVTAAVQAIDWLELHPDGHRRASFSSSGGRWLQP
jgi:pyridoxamine 5'-phosphate oxidase